MIKKRSSAPKKQPNSSKSLSKPSSTGTETVSSDPIKPKEDIIVTDDPISSLDSLLNNHLQTPPKLNENESPIVESRRLLNGKTWSDKSNGLDPIILTTKLLETLDQVSTLNEKGLTPYWTSQSKDISKKLWLPTKTDSVVSVMTSSNESSKTTPKGKSWFSIKEKRPLKKNSLMTSYQLSQYSLPDSMDYEVINSKNKSKNKQEEDKKENEEKRVKTLKVRLFPTEKEQQDLLTMMNQQRWYYNAYLSMMNKVYSPEQLVKPKSWSYNRIRDMLREYEYSEEKVEKDGKEMIQKDFTKIEGKDEYPLPRNGETNDLWWEEVNGRVIRGAAKKFTMALNSGVSNLKAGNIKSFHMKYKSRKDLISFIHFDDGNYPAMINKIRSTYWFRTKKTIEGKKKTRTHIKLSDIISQTKKTSIEVILDKVDNRFYVHITVPEHWYPNSDVRNESQAKYTAVKDTIMALDPGIRKFLVGYDPNHTFTYFAEDAQTLIINKLLEVDKCADDTKLKKWKQISNLISEMHWKSISYLIEHYSVILLPDFRVSQMLRQRKLGHMTKRLMSLFSFYQFKQRLISKCIRYDKKLYIVDESFTSKCCGVCGNLDYTLGSKKVYNCKCCGVHLDRDASGARNILLKHLNKRDNLTFCC
jgi:transposase